LSRKIDPSVAPRDREVPTEIVARGRGTLAFEPGFSLETQYAGEAPQFAEGSQFGVYVVGPCIGEGGMARVYRAEHAGLKRQVALKVMTASFARDSEGRERFLREARIAAAIKHPNVVNIFDVGVCQGIPYLVMELLEGEDLEKVLLSQGALDENAIVDLVVPVVAGLVAVHDAGIVHRDLKPGNIFLARGRNDEVEPKLLDFGISKASGKDHLRLTAANGSLMGTPFYMAPEAIQGSEMTPLSDQYALAVVLRECATGKNPFEGNSFAEVVGLISSAKYSPMTESHPRLSKRFVAIVERAMSVDPNNRFSDMRAMGRQLLLLAGQRTRITWGLTFGQEARGTVALAHSERNAPDAHEASPRVEPRPKRGTLVLLAGVAVVSAGLTSLFLTNDKDSSAASNGAGEPDQVVLENRGGRVGDARQLELGSEPSSALVASQGRVEPAALAAGPAQLEAEPPAAVMQPAVAEPAVMQPAVAERAVAEVEKSGVPEEAKPRPAPRPVAKSNNDRRARPVPPRRRPRPAAAEDRAADWEVSSSSKSNAASRRDVEVGSNSAPILD
jgi:serine/threonine protein kinase